MAARSEGATDRRALPPADRLASAHIGVRNALKLRLIPAVVLGVVLLASVAGAVLIYHQEGTDKAALDTHGVRVTGRVIGHYIEQTKDNVYYYNEVTWRFAGHSYEDDDTDGPYGSPDQLTPVGGAAQLLVDPKDPFTYAIDGSYNDVGQGAAGALLLVLAGICAVVGAWLSRVSLKLWRLARRGPFIAVTVGELHHELRGRGRKAHTVTTATLVGDDPRLPVTVGNHGAREGHALWLVLGDDRALVCEPGGYMLHQYTLHPQTETKPRT